MFSSSWQAYVGFLDTFRQAPTDRQSRIRSPSSAETQSTPRSSRAATMSRSSATHLLRLLCHSRLPDVLQFISQRIHSLNLAHGQPPCGALRTRCHHRRSYRVPNVDLLPSSPDRATGSDTIELSQVPDILKTHSYLRYPLYVDPLWMTGLASTPSSLRIYLK